ncbi:MAG: type II toxin-antitoxin system RelE/ParE family toxin [Polaribacter sp.]
MNYNVTATLKFKRKLKKLLHKYPSLRNEYDSLIQSLEIKPKQGRAIGKGCYKIRLAIQSKGKGKSGGARVITYVAVIEEEVFLLTIFDKSEIESISKKELAELLKEIN